MIKTWHEGTPDIAKERVFNKIDRGIREMLGNELKECLPSKGVKDIATTLMSKKIGKNLYISPAGRKYRRVTPNGKEASKTRTKH